MQSQRKTGGRPAAKPPTTTTAKIISLVSDEPGFALLEVSITSPSMSRAIMSKGFRPNLLRFRSCSTGKSS